MKFAAEEAEKDGDLKNLLQQIRNAIHVSAQETRLWTINDFKTVLDNLNANLPEIISQLNQFLGTAADQPEIQQAAVALIEQLLDARMSLDAYFNPAAQVQVQGQAEAGRAQTAQAESRAYFERFSKGIPWNLIQRLALTLGILGLYFLGRMVPIPGVNPAAFAQINTGSLWKTVSFFGGGMLEKRSVFGLGLAPYFSASFIVMLLSTFIPQLKDLQRSGEVGRKHLEVYIKWVSRALAMVQAVVFVMASPYLFGTLALQLIAIFVLFIGAEVVRWFNTH